jgi:hypothetical protein
MAEGSVPFVERRSDHASGTGAENPNIKIANNFTCWWAETHHSFTPFNADRFLIYVFTPS